MNSSDRTPHHRILSLEVTSGFLDGVSLEFCDGLNCIIGGRGTGKTTLLEFIRWAFDLMPHRRDHPEDVKRLEGLLKENLKNGEVRVRVNTKHGVSYMAKRQRSGDSVFLRDDEIAAPVRFDSDAVFTADIFSQNEIERIAGRTSLQLRLIDRLCGEKLQRVSKAIVEESETLAKRSLVDRELEHALAEGGGGGLGVASLEERLLGLSTESGPDAGLLESAHTQAQLRKRERLEFDRLVDAIGALPKSISEIVDEYISKTRTLLGAQTFSTSPNAASLGEARPLPTAC